MQKHEKECEDVIREALVGSPLTVVFHKPRRSPKIIAKITGPRGFLRQAKLASSPRRPADQAVYARQWVHRVLAEYSAVNCTK